MDRKRLVHLINQRKTFLCVGLDPDPLRIPTHLLQDSDPLFSFNKAIIDATRDLCVAYKPNLAFYEVMGEKGWQSLKKTVDYIGSDHLIIADAKRGDIGNTAKKYAEAFFEHMHCDAVTLSPYMGYDAVLPFLSYKEKWSIILALTSNDGSADFQLSPKEKPLYETVIEVSSAWGSEENTMYVIGATQDALLKGIRKMVPKHFLLVPGVGAQGGSLSNVVKHLWIPKECGLLVNSSRGIIYAGGKELDFSEGIRASAKNLQLEMSNYF